MIKCAISMKGMYMPVVFIMVFSLLADAQGLKKGDILPELNLTNVWNDKGKISLTQPAKKLVILHFWDTRCKGCWTAIQKIDTLQKKFSKHIRFVLVSAQAETEIAAFFAGNKKIKVPGDVIFLVGDTVLKKYFPYETVPHQVWLGGGKKVVAITSNSNTNVRAIETFLKENDIDLPEKRIEVKQNWQRPALSVFYNENKIHQAYYSYLLPAIDSIRQEYSVNYAASNPSKPTRLLIHKSSVVGLYIAAFDENRNKYSLSYGNVQLDLKQRDLYTLPEDESEWSKWNKENLYLYDLKVPEHTTMNLFDVMKQDLGRAFPLKAAIVQQQKNCMVLRLNDTGENIATKGSRSGVYSPKVATDSMLVLTNVPFSSFTSRLQALLRKNNIHFFTDATRYAGKVDISIHASLFNNFDMELLRKNLLRYGLILKEEECLQDVLVITDE